MLADVVWTSEAEIYEDVEGASVWEAVSRQAAAFVAAYRTWTAGGAADLAATLAQAHQVRADLGAAWQAKRDAGDAEGAAALAPAIADADAAVTALTDAEQQAAQYGTTWDNVASWLDTLSGWTGLAALPLLPLGITAAVAVASVTALLYVVTTWQTQRARVAYLADLAGKVARGEVSPAQVQALTAAIDAPGGGLFGGFFSGLGTAGLLAAGVLAWLLLRR